MTGAKVFLVRGCSFVLSYLGILFLLDTAKHYKMTTKFICVSGDFYLREDKTLHVEDLFARK